MKNKPDFYVESVIIILVRKAIEHRYKIDYILKILNKVMDR